MSGPRWSSRGTHDANVLPTGDSRQRLPDGSASGRRHTCDHGRVNDDPKRFTQRIEGYQPLVDDDFDMAELDPSIWLPYYLPQWAGRASSGANYRIRDGCLELFIAPEQRPWLPGVEGDLRVSSVQTGCFAGPIGSTIGQHRTSDELRVVEEQETVRLVTPTFAAIELRARWTPVVGQMVALWMIGFEDEPERSAEICVCEIFGDEADRGRALIGMGVHPFNDPCIEDDFEQVEATLDVGDWHDFAAIWTPDDVTFFVDDEPVKRVEQSPKYPMQLMLDIYDFEPPSPDRSSAPFLIDRLRVLQPRREEPSGRTVADV